MKCDSNILEYRKVGSRFVPLDTRIDIFSESQRGEWVEIFKVLKEL